MTLHIDSLVIECTRRCNMTCEHCLRGDAEEVDVDICHVHSLFKQIDSIGCLTLSGGEPSLVPYIIQWIREVAFTAKVDVGNFYIATNGKDVPDNFVYEVVRWYGQCTDNESSQVKISRDQYHDDDVMYNPMLELLTITTCDHIDYSESSIICDGHAAYNGIGYRDKCDETFEVDVDGDDIRVSEGDMYMNVHGNIIGGCDWSYTSQEEHVIGHISKLNLTKWALEMEAENNGN